MPIDQVMDDYLANIASIVRNEQIASLPFSDEITKALFVFQPLTADFGPIKAYYTNHNERGEVDFSEECSERHMQVSKYVNSKCSELGFIQDLSIFNFIKNRLKVLDVSVNELPSVLEAISGVEELDLWCEELITPLINCEVHIKTNELFQLNDFQILDLLLQNFDNDCDLLQKTLPFVSKHWDLFNDWFEAYAETHLLGDNIPKVIKNYELVLLSIFENDDLMKQFISHETQFDQFVSILLACFYLCPTVNERALIVFKNILFIISQYIPTQQECEFDEIEADTLKEISQNLSLKSLPYFNKLIASIENLYQLNVSIRDVIKLVDNYEMQSLSINNLIEYNLKGDLSQLYNSISWVQMNTKFFNKVSKQETDSIFLNKLIKFKKFTTLGVLVDKLDIPELGNIVLKDFHNNFRQSSNFNLNSHHLQDCLKDLALLKSVNPAEYLKLSKLLDSFKILTNFKLSNKLIKPSDILQLSSMEVVDRIFELNEDVDIFEIYELLTNLIIGLDDLHLKTELDKSKKVRDPVYEYKNLISTDDRILVRLLLVELKYSRNWNNNFKMIINLLSNYKMSDLLLENWFIIYQYISVQQPLEEDQDVDEIKEIERSTQILKIISLIILIVPIEFNSRISQQFTDLMNEVNAKIKALQNSNLSEGAKPKMDLESRIARAFTSSTKDILKDFLV